MENINIEKKNKKVWITPEVILISQANVEGGGTNSAHEANWTPNHTHYAPNGNGPFPVAVFNNCVS